MRISAKRNDCWSIGSLVASSFETPRTLAAQEAGRWMRADAGGYKACYGWLMSKSKQPGAKAKKKDFVIGRASFGKISAVEGIRLTPAMKNLLMRHAPQREWFASSG